MIDDFIGSHASKKSLFVLPKVLIPLSIVDKIPAPRRIQLRSFPHYTVFTAQQQIQFVSNGSLKCTIPLHQSYIFRGVNVDVRLHWLSQ